MMPLSKRLEITLRWVFGSPWIVTVFMALLGTASAWLLLQADVLFAWNRLAIGTILGAFVGALFSVETHFSLRADVKFMINGGLGVLAGCIVAILLQLGSAYILVAALAGFALGVTSKYWMAHINLP
ncbi:hypothetical protein [Ralstonia solanacearum]|uniref:hypothetical protein n=2 Tax=Ralstonia solanacearum TaxID=305 RepID=UPI0001816FD0|nr:hypothetical protein [Ralstonia solanacearum]MDC6180676.1 hypothetical protein [Ralstonia solanacearum]MDC6213344.1 hypothetical protein [Ralstonia solanacearum]MDC6242308.1 hypothetical protein [Ralstonia solanacearum]MDD7803945.1 hypothetical protein [Ralstonia solanacearum]